MLILLLVIFGIIWVFCWILSKDGFPFFSSLIMGGLAIFTFYCWMSISTEHVLDQKIVMYEEENTSIEQSIGSIVEDYMDYESNAYSDLKSQDLMELVTNFPELKADALVQEELDIYIENNQKIKELKEEKIDLLTMKWLLYFGK